MLNGCFDLSGLDFCSRHETPEFVFGQGPRAEEPLIKITAPVGEQGQLGGALYALDDDLELEFSSETDHRFHDNPVSLAPHDIGDQAAIDLDHVERQGGQVGEARIAGPEIVDRNGDPRFAQPGKPGSNLLLVDEQRALGDLRGYAGWVDTRIGDLFEQPVVVTFTANILGQQVDRQLESLERTFPYRRGSKRLALDEPRQSLGKAGGGCPGKQARRRRFNRRSDKRLGAGHSSAEGFDLRLIENLDTFVCNELFEVPVRTRTDRRLDRLIGRTAPPRKYTTPHATGLTRIAAARKHGPRA